jgi:hypothetical protein
VVGVEAGSDAVSPATSVTTVRVSDPKVRQILLELCHELNRFLAFGWSERIRIGPDWDDEPSATLPLTEEDTETVHSERSDLVARRKDDLDHLISVFPRSGPLKELRDEAEELMARLEGGTEVEQLLDAVKRLSYEAQYREDLRQRIARFSSSFPGLRSLLDELEYQVKSMVDRHYECDDPKLDRHIADLHETCRRMYQDLDGLLGRINTDR